MKIRAKELVEDHLIGEHAPFSFTLKEGGEEVRAAPCVFPVCQSTSIAGSTREVVHII